MWRLFGILRILLTGALALLFGTILRAEAAAADLGASPPSAGDGHAYVLVLLKLPVQHLRPGAGYGDSYGDGVGRTARRHLIDDLASRFHLTLVEDWPMPAAGVDCYVMIVSADQTAVHMAEVLSKAPGVAWSEPMSTYHAQGASMRQGGHARPPVDYGREPLFPAQPAGREWRLQDLHALSTGHNIRVAVIDSRVDATHPDLLGQVELSEDFVPAHPAAAEQHGTAVAGVIAARSNNQLGIVGVAPGARILALRACWEGAGASASTVCDSLALAKAINSAISHRAQVINLSLSGPPDPLLARLLDVAIQKGATVVAAYDGKLSGGGFPADHPGVVAVSDNRTQGSVTSGVGGRGSRSSVSGQSAAGAPGIGAILAPGRDIPTTRPDGRWYFVNGSSYSAAHVSGLAALMRELAPRRQDLSTAVALGPGGDVDVCATLLRVRGPCDCACAHPASPAGH